MSCHGAAPIGLEGLEGALGREGKLRRPEECLGTVFRGLLDTGLLFGDGLLFNTGLFLGSGDLLRDRESRLERDLCLRPRRGVRESLRLLRRLLLGERDLCLGLSSTGSDFWDLDMCSTTLASLSTVAVNSFSF